MNWGRLQNMPDGADVGFGGARRAARRINLRHSWLLGLELST
jgi:hypothetical protein